MNEMNLKLFDVREIAPDALASLVVTAANVDGHIRPLSLYSDYIWILPGGTRNMPDSVFRLNFARVPESFRDQMRVMVFRYMRRGRIGGTRVGPRQIARFFDNAIQFFDFLLSVRISSLSATTPFACALYVHDRKKYRKQDGAARSADFLRTLFTNVEALFELSQATDDPMPSFPWPGSSASRQAGITGRAGRRGGESAKTPLIPDNVLCELFRAASECIDEAPHLLDLRDRLDQVRSSMPTASEDLIRREKNELLVAHGWNLGLTRFRRRLTEIRTASYIIVATLSGCRNHELANVQQGACYSTIDDDGNEYWWLRSSSEKTGEGYTEWMIPAAAKVALDVMDRWSEPFQRLLRLELDNRRSADPADAEIAAAQRHLGAIFVGCEPKQKLRVRTLSNMGLNYDLKTFAKRNGIAWKLSTHQFRRTFANYAARSQFGDLRYLKEHFKHWSFDMTLGYALNEHQELSLYAEVYDELGDIRERLIDSWLMPDTRLGGGLGKRVIAWRGNHDVTLFKDHRSMVRTLATGFGHLRSNGHAWCTADQGLACVGNGGLDRSRCGGCEHGVVGAQHMGVYEQMHEHLQTLLELEDVGPGGIRYVERSLERCRDVLASIDCDLKEVACDG